MPHRCKTWQPKNSTAGGDKVCRLGADEIEFKSDIRQVKRKFPWTRGVIGSHIFALFFTLVCNNCSLRGERLSLTLTNCRLHKGCLHLGRWGSSGLHLQHLSCKLCIPSSGINDDILKGLFISPKWQGGNECFGHSSCLCEYISASNDIQQYKMSKPDIKLNIDPCFQVLCSFLAIRFSVQTEWTIYPVP